MDDEEIGAATDEEDPGIDDEIGAATEDNDPVMVMTFVHVVVPPSLDTGAAELEAG
jgi:hypothetical protein